MQLNTPTDQRQIHNYQRLFIKFRSSLCLYFFFLVTVVGGGIWLLLLVFFVSTCRLCFSLNISYSYSRQFHDLCVF